MPEQVAIIYAGINGHLDDIPIEKVTAFNKDLREYLRTSMPKFGELIQSEKKLGDEAEGILKEALTECKKNFMATA